MPRRISNPFSGNTSTTTVSDRQMSDKPHTQTLRTSSRSNRIVQYFSPSLGKSGKSFDSGAIAVANANAANTAYPSPAEKINTPSSLALPTISLSTATADGSKAISESGGTTTLFMPPTAAESLRLQKQYAQFGPLGSPAHRFVSQHPGGELPDPVTDEAPYYTLITTYISYLLLIAVGHVLDFLAKNFRPQDYLHLKEHNGFAALVSDFDSFYSRRLKVRLDDCFARPITGVPGRYITLLDRATNDHNLSFRLTGTTTETLNISSYNYLGFAQSDGPCADAAEEAIKTRGLSLASPRTLGGTTDLHLEVEQEIAKFVGKESSMVFSMGYGTNATIFPALVSKGCLIISDELNHASIRFGARLSGAVIQMFKHNDMKELEKVLRAAVSQGQPRTHRPWKKILVVVEGLYSMEGTMCNLPGILKLKDRYKFYLFVDEAHSIGAMGPHGRGVCDYFSIDPARVDILMGTLTKSFGANGGYIAGDKLMIDHLRLINAGSVYSEAPSPFVLAQILSSLRIISGELNPGQGEERLQRLVFNARYLRLGLKRLGFIVYGHDDSPIIPLVLYNPAKMPAFSREMLRRKISVVVVGYPATDLIHSRARFCVSAAHTKDDMDRILAACDEVGDVMQLKTSTGIAGGASPLPQGVKPEEEAAWRKERGLEPYVPPRWKLADVLRTGVQDVKQALR